LKVKREKIKNLKHGDTPREKKSTEKRKSWSLITLMETKEEEIERRCLETEETTLMITDIYFGLKPKK